MRTPLSRRTVLRAAGATLCLPFLESMTPLPVRAAANAGPPRRFVGMMTNMGILPEYFFPTRPGRDHDSSPYLDILKDHRDAMTVFSGVSLPGVDGGHEAERCFLTGAPGASRGSFKNSVSLDQVMAESLGGATRFPSLPIGIGGENLSLSWTRSGSMIPPVLSPVALYQRLFIEESPEGQTAAVRRLQSDRSLLDALRDQYRALQNQVTPADRERLDQFATAIRDLEKNLAAAESWVHRPKPKTDIPQPAEIADPHAFAGNARVMLDLARLAIETDATRVVTVFLSTGDLTPKGIPGVSSGTHPLTHHGQQPDKIAELRRIEEAHFQVLREFLTKLRGVSEPGGGTLLDRTACLYGTSMGSANSHSNDNLPVLLAGGGFRHAGHLAFDRRNNYPLSNLYVSLLQRLGIESDRFSSGAGTMTGLDFA